MFGQPDGDVNPSTSSSRGTGTTERGIHDRPAGDVSSSSTTGDSASTGRLPGQFPGVAEGGAVPFLSQDRTQGTEGHVYGSGQAAGDHATPFFSSSSGDLPINRAPGPDVEQPRRSTNRPVHNIHIGKITSRATKELNRDLMNAAEFSNDERRQVSARVRSDACAQIMEIWCRKANYQRDVFALKLLLIKAGGADEGKYEQLIRDIVDHPP